MKKPTAMTTIAKTISSTPTVLPWDLNDVRATVTSSNRLLI
jgi:hypothetical protein